MASTEIVNKILFNYKSKNYSFLSNFYVSEMSIDNKLYYHVEGFYQSSKYTKVDTKTAEHIRNITIPHVAKTRGDSKEFLITSEVFKEWNDIIKVITMKRALITKFITNGDLAKKLVETRELELINNSQDDSYWGIGLDGKGTNMLGKMLMEIRDLLNELPDIDYD